MHKVTRSLAKKALAPVAASATAYAAKKLPELYRQKIAPKLEERGGARAAAQDVTKRLGNEVQSAAETVSQKVGIGSESPAANGDTTNGSAAAPSTSFDRDDARRKRERNRQARREAST